MCLLTRELRRRKTRKKREEEKVEGRRQKCLDILCWQGGHRGERKDRQTNDVLSGKV